MSSSAVVFSYFIGLIFTIGGLVFLIGLDDNRFLYGVPYLLMGIVIIGGVMGSQRRTRRKQREERDTPPPGGRETPY
ncbi:MAG: hypothetical protein AB7V42_12345 [Thermoleophilia bacterium]